MLEHVQSSAGPGPASRSVSHILASRESAGAGPGGPARAGSGRRRLAIAAVGWALIAACTWVRAADEPPPLEQIKGDLKTVKTGNALEASAPSAGPKLVVPVFIPPPEEPAGPPPAIALPGAKENKRATDANWLLHAMEPLSGAQQTHRARQAGAQQGELRAPDPSDPNYMLAVYRAQEAKDRKDREAQGRDTRSLDGKPGDIGSFSDLFQHWIAPQDLKLFGAKTDVPTVLDDGFTLPDELPSVAPVEPPTAIAAPPKPNPFLDSTQPLFLPPEVPEGAPASHADLNLPPPPHNPPETQPATPPPDSHRDTAPPARSAEDKKYFPQLDRF